MSQHGQFKRVGSAVAETFVSVSPTSKKEETPESSEIEADPEKQAKLNQLKSPSEAQQETVVHGNPEGIEAFQQLSLAEMAETRVTFGRTHVGKTYEELWNQEKGWIKWFCKTYQDSTKEEHRKLLIYVERKVERLELEHELPTLEAPAVQQGIVRPRSEAMPKAKSASTPPTETVTVDDTNISEEIWEPWDVTLPMDGAEMISQQENIGALQVRVLNIENALTEILTLIRPPN
ncbi:unnamed protein product [Cladocopium goreaui]|uniref:CCHC-type domain-containing protein n=1 Tax=Cladocopium goreaui TaxID=2562237 RepID=A0A9P1D3F8_9DINO|nr:unnamed protein product [Cladocopium goreaui]